MADAPQVFLEPDDEIRGQKFICLSFLSPEKVLKNKDLYFFRKFLEFYALDYKVKATESFLMGQLRDLQSVLGDVQVDLENTAGSIDSSKTELNAYRVPEVQPEVQQTATDVSGAAVTETATDVSGCKTVVEVNPLQKPRDIMLDASKTLKVLVEKVTKTRGSLAQITATSLDEHVKANMTDFRESTILEAYEGYMVVNKQKLEDEFHKENSFRTTVRGLKCRGTYSTHEQAVARAQSLHKKDPHFNVYVAEVGQWLPWDPEPDEVADQQYSNEQLNTLMQSYRENATKRDEFFEEQKRQRIAEAHAASAAANAASAAAKKATFGEKGKEIEAAQLARDLFDGAADLALQKKADTNTISHN